MRPLCAFLAPPNKDNWQYHCGIPSPAGTNECILLLGNKTDSCKYLVPPPSKKPMKPSCKHLIPPAVFTNLYRCSVLCNVRDGKPGDCQILMGKTDVCEYLVPPTVRKPTRPSCRYFWPPSELIHQWHCHMGPARTGDCHIFQGKAEVCNFQWPQEEEIERKNGDLWIVLEPGGDVSIFEEKAGVIKYLKDDYDLGKKYNTLIENVVVFHVCTMEKYKVKVVDSIKLISKWVKLVPEGE